MQSLAGGVFSEVSQFGNSVGLAVTAAIAASVTEHSGAQDHKDALMEGFRGRILDDLCQYGHGSHYLLLWVEERGICREEG